MHLLFPASSCGYVLHFLKLIASSIHSAFVVGIRIPQIGHIASSDVSVPSLPAGGKTRGGFHKTAPYELHGSVSRLTLSDNAQHNSAAAML